MVIKLLNKWTQNSKTKNCTKPKKKATPTILKKSSKKSGDKNPKLPLGLYQKKNSEYKTFKKLKFVTKLKIQILTKLESNKTKITKQYSNL